MVPLQVLAEKDLSAGHLAEQMEIMMEKQSYGATFSLDGAGKTARLLLAEGEEG
jgi:predicted glycosyltransferase